MPPNVESPAAELHTTADTLSQSAESLARAIEVMSGDRESIAWDGIEARLAEPGQNLTGLRHMLTCGTAALTHLFLNGAPAGRLVRDRARLVDLIVLTAWRRDVADVLPGAALIAVGG